MSFYNGILNHDDIHGSGQIGQRGQRGLPGVGFKVDADGNYDIENKKLTNVQNGDMDHDVMVKSQIEGYVSNKTQYLDGVNPGQVINNKAVIYSPSGSIHTNDLYLKDKNGQEVHFHNEDQDLNQCRLYIPNLKNYDSYGGRRKSDIMVTSINQRIEGKKVFNDIEVPTPTLDNQATNKQYVDNNFLNRLAGGQIGGDLDMRGHSIRYLKFDKAPDAVARVAELNNKADKSDLDNYFKLDGTNVMTGNLQMNGNSIVGLSNPPSDMDQATNKEYVDSQISKANIKPSHTPKNVFKYLMNDVNEWSSEYNIRVLNFSDLAESPHSWDKRVLNITPVKDGKNYRFRLGLQMFPMKTNETYSLIVEFYNRDFKTWQRQQTYVNGTGLWVKSYNTTKFQHRYGSSGDLYYTKTLIKFKKTSSSAPIFVYFTVHFDDNGGDMNTYPKDFKNQVYIIAYGIVGETHVDPWVYDAHQAFEIDKTKMKMLVPLDMNGKQLMNVNLDLNFGNIFKIENCFVHDNHPSSQRLYKILRKRNNNTLVPFIISVPVVLVSFNLPPAFNIKLYDKAFIEIGERITNKITRIALKNLNTILLQIYKNGLKHIHFYNIGSSQFDLDVILSYM